MDSVDALPNDAASRPTRTEYSATMLRTTQNSHRNKAFRKITAHHLQPSVSHPPKCRR